MTNISGKKDKKEGTKDGNNINIELFEEKWRHLDEDQKDAVK